MALERPARIVALNRQLMQAEGISVELGPSLTPIKDSLSSKVLDKFSFRLMILRELGLHLPKLAFRDNPRLAPNAYAIKVHELGVAEGRLEMERFLAIDPEEKLASLAGTRTTDPTYGLPGIWIGPGDRSYAERSGCIILDAVSVVVTHLDETVRDHAAGVDGSVPGKRRNVFAHDPGEAAAKFFSRDSARCLLRASAATHHNFDNLALKSGK